MGPVLVDDEVELLLMVGLIGILTAGLASMDEDIPCCWWGFPYVVTVVEVGVEEIADEKKSIRIRVHIGFTFMGAGEFCLKSLI